MVRRDPVPLDVHPERDLAGEQRRPQVGRSAVRQVSFRLNFRSVTNSNPPRNPLPLFQDHQPVGEQDRGVVRVRRGLAQLPPRVPLGLQDGRARQLPDEHDDGVYRLFLVHWLGVRPQDRLERDHREAGEANRRRLPQHVGLGRQGPGQGRDRPRQDHQPEGGISGGRMCATLT